MAAPLLTGAGEIAASAAVAKPNASPAQRTNVLIILNAPSCFKPMPVQPAQNQEIGAARAQHFERAKAN
jgi:hypothetical protein